MEANVLNVGGLEHVLQTHWAEVLDSTLIRRAVSLHVSENDFLKQVQDAIPKRQLQLTVSKFKIETCEKEKREWFDVAIEFTAPKNDGVVVGTVVCEIYLDGFCRFIKWYGTHLCPRKP